MKPTGIFVVRSNEYTGTHHYLLYSDKTGTETFYICYYKAAEQPCILNVDVFIKEIKKRIVIKKHSYTKWVNVMMIKLNYEQSVRRLELEVYLTT